MKQNLWDPILFLCSCYFVNDRRPRLTRIRHCLTMWSLKLLLFSFLSAPFLALSSALDSSSPVLAGPITEHCIEGFQHTGTARGTNVTIADVPTYFSEPATPSDDKKKVLLFFSDIYSPFYVNNQLLQDYFASEGVFRNLLLQLYPVGGVGRRRRLTPSISPVEFKFRILCSRYRLLLW